MALRALLALLLLTALVSGCVEDGTPPADTGNAFDDADEEDQADAIPSGQAPAGNDGGTSSGHAQPKRTESAVTVTQQGTNSYQARKVVTITNDFGGASAADVTVEVDTGGVSADSWSKGGYEMVATLSASGATEQQARDRLAQMRVVHSDKLANGRLTLDTEVPSGPGGGGIRYRLPASPNYRLTLTTETGGVSTSGLGGSVLTVNAETGGIDASGSFNTATLTTQTGGIDISGVYNTLRATAETGGIDARVKAAASGTHTYEVDTGGIDVVLTGGSDHGYDVEASADTGGVTVDLDDGSDVGTQSRTHKHVRTDGYDSKAVKLKVSATADTGGVDVSG